MQKVIISEMAALIARDFGIENPDNDITEAEILALVANEIAYMIEHRIDFLMSLLYRLDVLEKDINFALSPYCESPPNIALAKLVVDRQKQRVISKKTYKQTTNEDLGDLAW